MEEACKQKIQKVLPWAWGELIEVMIRVNKEEEPGTETHWTGAPPPPVWDGGWITTIWKDPFFAKTFRAAVNYQEITNAGAELSYNTSHIGIDYQGQPIVPFGYDMWMPQGAELVRSQGSGMITVHKDKRDEVYTRENQQGRERMTISTTGRNREQRRRETEGEGNDHQHNNTQLRAERANTDEEAQ